MSKYDDIVTIQTGWHTLQQYGINALTGEADSYSLRILCDLSLEGVQLMEGFMGNTVKLTEGTNWNGWVGNDLAVSSIMLPYSVFDDLRRYILFHIEHKVYVYHFKSGQMSGTMESVLEDIDKEDLENTYVNYGAMKGSQDNIGGRNVHAATGRVT